MTIQGLNKNFTIYAGVSSHTRFQLLDENGNEADLSSAIIGGYIEFTDSRYHLLSERGMLRIRQDTGEIILDLMDSDTVSFENGSFQYSIYVIFGSTFQTVVEGTVVVVDKSRWLYGQTAWDDLRIAAVSTKLGGTKDPNFLKLKDNGSGSQGVFTYWFDPSTEEELYFLVQLPHHWAEGTALKPHVHWVPASNGSSGQFVVWGLEYTIADVSENYGNTVIIKSLATTAAEATVQGDASLVAGKHYITALPEIEMTGKKLSSMLVCRIFRDAVAGTDDYPADAGLLEVDFHYEVDSFGSDDEYVK